MPHMQATASEPAAGRDLQLALVLVGLGGLLLIALDHEAAYEETHEEQHQDKQHDAEQGVVAHAATLSQSGIAVDLEGRHLALDHMDASSCPCRVSMPEVAQPPAIA